MDFYPHNPYFIKKPMKDWHYDSSGEDKIAGNKDFVTYRVRLAIDLPECAASEAHKPNAGSIVPIHRS